MAQSLLRITSITALLLTQHTFSLNTPPNSNPASTVNAAPGGNLSPPSEIKTMDERSGNGQVDGGALNNNNGNGLPSGNSNPNSNGNGIKQNNGLQTGTTNNLPNGGGSNNGVQSSNNGGTNNPGAPNNGILPNAANNNPASPMSSANNGNKLNVPNSHTTNGSKPGVANGKDTLLSVTFTLYYMLYINFKYN